MAGLESNQMTLCLKYPLSAGTMHEVQFLPPECPTRGSIALREDPERSEGSVSPGGRRPEGVYLE